MLDYITILPYSTISANPQALKMKAKVQAAEKNAKMLDKIIDFYLHPIEIQDFNAFCKRYQIHI